MSQRHGRGSDNANKRSKPPWVTMRSEGLLSSAGVQRPQTMLHVRVGAALAKSAICTLWHIPGDGALLVDPPLRAVTPLDRLIAAIENHDDTKLKLKGIASGKRAVKHIDGMVKGYVP